MSLQVFTEAFIFMECVGVVPSFKTFKYKPFESLGGKLRLFSALYSALHTIQVPFYGVLPACVTGIFSVNIM